MSTPIPPTKPYTGDPKQHSLSTFNESITGTCLCGAISVTIHENIFSQPARGHLCHCSNCRKVAGSYVSSNMIVEKGNVEVKDEKGTLKVYEDYATGSGKCVRRWFCSACGNPIMSEPEVRPNSRIVKMGMFPRIPKPEMEGFAEHRQEWQGVHEGVVQFALGLGGKKLGE